eukprot:TRINITY_DN31912_c0_g1_i1.p1 TRINITY_DN31912_c0_g1~~TRINITY_DN31912_c0_g1_i1.p1  ORF type:complete len:513 (+),score=72.89 TRINITY_DN31912_c0_g1_i1:54-1592(+)
MWLHWLILSPGVAVCLQSCAPECGLEWLEFLDPPRKHWRPLKLRAQAKERCCRAVHSDVSYRRSLPLCPPPPPLACEQKKEPDGWDEYMEQLTRLSEYYFYGPQAPEYKVFSRLSLQLLEALQNLRCMSGCGNVVYSEAEWNTTCAYTRGTLNKLGGHDMKCESLYRRPDGIVDWAEKLYAKASNTITQPALLNTAPPAQMPVLDEFWAPPEFRTGPCGDGQLPQPYFAGEDKPLAWRDVSNLPVRHLQIFGIFEKLGLANIKMSWQVVNIGANDGTCSSSGHDGNFDVANCVWQAIPHIYAVLVEGNPDLLDRLKELASRMGRTVVPVLSMVTPKNIKSIMEEHGIKPDIDLLKIDIDNGDCEIAAAMLYLRPKVIHIEIASFIPPPFIFRKPFNYSASTGPACSLAATAQVLEGYRLLQVESEDAVFIRSDLANAFEPFTLRNLDTAWRLGYFCKPLGLALANWLDFPIRYYADPAVPQSLRLSHLRNFKFPRGPEIADDEPIIDILERY